MVEVSGMRFSIYIWIYTFVYFLGGREWGVVEVGITYV